MTPKWNNNNFSYKLCPIIPTDFFGLLKNESIWNNRYEMEADFEKSLNKCVNNCFTWGGLRRGNTLPSPRLGVYRVYRRFLRWPC